MFSPRVFRPAIILFLSGAMAGCSHWSRSSDSLSSNESAAQPAATQPVADTATADALALKVSEYRHDLEEQMAQAAAAAAAAKRPATAPAETADHPILHALSLPSDDALRFSAYPQETAPPARRAAPPAANAADAPAPPGETTAANFPLSVPEGSDQGDSGSEAQKASAVQTPVLSADEMERKLAQHLRDDPKDLEGQLDYELLLFIEGQPVPQMSALAGLRNEDREILAAVMDGLSNFRSVIRDDNNALLASKTQPLIDMSDRLRTQAELTLSAVALCSDVTTFGVYKPVDTGWFKAGRDKDTQVVVYCQVQNFQSRLSPENQWQTQLSEEMTLYTESGVQVWPEKSHPQGVLDLCRQRRHDLFVANLIAIPHTLPAGRYLLKISITDEQADRVAEATTPVVITAQ
jgi:hypothetical protein